MLEGFADSSTFSRYYIYALYLDEELQYIGSTSNLVKRIQEHRIGHKRDEPILFNNWGYKLSKGQTKKEAEEEEHDLIEIYDPPYNEDRGIGNCRGREIKITSEIYNEAERRRAKGETWVKIAKELKVKESTLRHAISNRLSGRSVVSYELDLTKNIKDLTITPKDLVLATQDEPAPRKRDPRF
jgi:GIY-YIG catalytic domain